MAASVTCVTSVTSVTLLLPTMLPHNCIGVPLMNKYISEYLGILNGPVPPRPPLKSGGIAFRAKVAKANQLSQVATDPYHGNGGQTNQREREDQRARQYWAAYRAGQEAKREAGIEYQPPGWLVGRRSRRGAPKPSAPAPKTEPRLDQGELF
jgi:hypothetical protein